MGQPIQTLTAHVGQPQLWNWGVSVPNNERFFAGFTYRAHVAVRLVYLMFETFPKLFNNHMWLSTLWYFCRSAKHMKWTTNKHKLPDIYNKKYIQNRYYRFQPGTAIFQENDITYVEVNYNKLLPHSNYLWTQARIFSSKNVSLFWIRGIPFDQQINYLTLYKQLRTSKQINATTYWEYFCLQNKSVLPFLNIDQSLNSLQSIAVDIAERKSPILWF